MEQAKIMLSSKELELVNNADWILTKNAIIQKVYGMFGQLSESFRSMIEAHSGIVSDSGIRAPKISKGEQYEGLPWVMLDYPRNFTDEDAFGIRCFFWWGNFCSITLQLSGSYQQKYAANIRQYLKTNAGDWFIGLGTDPWKHHFRNDNYMPAADWQRDMHTIPFIKLAKKISLHNWDILDEFFENNYREIISMLANSGN